MEFINRLTSSVPRALAELDARVASGSQPQFGLVRPPPPPLQTHNPSLRSLKLEGCRLHWIEAHLPALLPYIDWVRCAVGCACAASPCARNVPVGGGMCGVGWAQYFPLGYSQK